MNRLVVNPGTEQAWEIQLKPGTNLLGRGASSDFTIDHPSVSGSHCQIVVVDDGAILKDLGSTNGTFLNSNPIQEAKLETGQTIRLGGVEMVFYSEATEPVTVTAVRPPPLSSVRLTDAASASPPLAPPVTNPAASGPRFCKFHPKSPARYLCNKCNRTFCEMCVISRNVGGASRRICRSCGVECVPLQGQAVQSKTGGFFSRLPGAFIYPFRGFGVAVLILAGLAFGGMQYLVSIGILWGPYGWIIRTAFFGFLFLFLQNIIHTTTSDENEALSFPAPDGLFGAAFQLGGTIFVCFGLAIGLVIAKLFDVDIPVAAIVAAVILGCFYFPMAFLAVAMKDTVLAANPLIVFPSIMKIPLQYFIASILLMSVFGVRQVGNLLSSGAGSLSMSTRDTSVLLMALGFPASWALVSIYLLAVCMRILGLLYNANKEKLGWF